MKKPASTQTLSRRSKTPAAAVRKPGAGFKTTRTVAAAPKSGQGKRPKNSDLKKRLAERLHAARVAYNENQSEVARALNVTSQVLSAAETGRNYPDALMLIRFCLISGCPMDWIFLGRMQSSMPPEMAARIGSLFPALLPDREAVERVAAEA